MTNTSIGVAAGCLGLAAMMSAPAALSQQPQYPAFSHDYIEANYVNTELDDSGLEIGASFEATDMLHFFASYLDQDLGGGLERSTFHLGGGYRWHLSPQLDLIAELGVADTKLDRRFGPDINSDGFIAGARMRGWMRQNVELNGAVLLDDSIDGDSDLVVEFGGQYYLNPQFSLGGRIRTDDDTTSLFLGLRYFYR